MMFCIVARHHLQHASVSRRIVLGHRLRHLRRQAHPAPLRPALPRAVVHAIGKNELEARLLAPLALVLDEAHPKRRKSCHQPDEKSTSHVCRKMSRRKP